MYDCVCLCAVVQEILRITPIVPALFRRALQDFEIAGCLVPKVVCSDGSLLCLVHVLPAPQLLTTDTGRLYDLEKSSLLNCYSNLEVL